MKKDFMVIRADGSKPYFIPQCGSINDTWHNLMCDPDRDLLFECVPVSIFGLSDLIFMVDECGKLKPHLQNSFASLFYPGFKLGDYIAGDVLVCRIGFVDSVMDDGTVIQEHDLLPLTADHVRMFESLLEVTDFVDS